MSEEQAKAEEQGVIQYAEEVDQELIQLRVAVWDLIDDLDVTGGFVELEAGRGSDGPVVRLCRMTSKPPSRPGSRHGWSKPVE
jgi:hypothetical protein